MSPSIPRIYRLVISPSVMLVVRGRLFTIALLCNSAFVPLYFHDGLPCRNAPFHGLFCIRLFPPRPSPPHRRHAAGFRWVICLVCKICAYINCTFHVSWVYSQAIRGVRLGFWETHHRITVWFVDWSFRKPLIFLHIQFIGVA